MIAFLIFIACACSLAIGIGIGIGLLITRDRSRKLLRRVVWDEGPGGVPMCVCSHPKNEHIISCFHRPCPCKDFTRRKKQPVL